MRRPYGFLQAVRRHYADQKDYAALMRMPDRDLRDLGVTRGEVRFMARQPFRFRRY